MREYELLRTAITEKEKAIVQYNSILYATVAVILTYALDKPNYFLSLIPYAVILPLYLLTEGCYASMCVMGTYFYVFHEGEDSEFRWEKRHQEFDKAAKHRAGPISWLIGRVLSRIHYFFITLICAFIATYKVIISDVMWTEKGISLTFTWLSTIAVIIVMLIKVTDWPSLRERFIKEWREVENKEKAQQKRNANRNPQ